MDWSEYEGEIISEMTGYVAEFTWPGRENNVVGWVALKNGTIVGRTSNGKTLKRGSAYLKKEAKRLSVAEETLRGNGYEVSEFLYDAKRYGGKIRMNVRLFLNKGEDTLKVGPMSRIDAYEEAVRRTSL